MRHIKIKGQWKYSYRHLRSLPCGRTTPHRGALLSTEKVPAYHIPDWVCEILSSSTTRDDRVVKRPLYARESVGHIWLIDPDQKTLEAYALQDGRWLLLGAHKDDDRVSLPPFEALELELSALWPRSGRV